MKAKLLNRCTWTIWALKEYSYLLSSLSFYPSKQYKVVSSQNAKVSCHKSKNVFDKPPHGPKMINLDFTDELLKAELRFFSSH